MVTDNWGFAMKTLTTSALLGTLIIAATPASAAFLMIKEDAYKLPSSPLTIITEAQENARLKTALAVTESKAAALAEQVAVQQQQIAVASDNLTIIKAELDKASAAIPKKVSVYFPFGSVTFKPTAEQADLITKNVAMSTKVKVNGFTDSIGDAGVNAAIALKRALSAKKYLMKEGVSEIRIRIYSKSGQYDYTNETEEGRAMNRRVDMHFTRNASATSVADNDSEEMIEQLPMTLAMNSMTSGRGF